MVDAARLIGTLLTSRGRHPTVVAIRHAARRIGLELHVGSSLDRRSRVVFQWGLRSGLGLSAVRSWCWQSGVAAVNLVRLDKREQMTLLAAAQVPVPRTRFVAGADEAIRAAEEIGYPLVLKPSAGSFSRGIAFAEDRAQLLARYRVGHRLIQERLSQGGRCTRVLVVGGRCVHATTRIARDGLRATWAHGRMARLAPCRLDELAVRTSVRACAALDIDVGGVDLVRDGDGYRVLEVNHRSVSFSDAPLHGSLAVDAIAERLLRLARDARAPRPRRHLHVVAPPPAWRRAAPTAFLAEVGESGWQVSVGERLDPLAERAVFWSATARGYREDCRIARLLGIRTWNGVRSRLWRQRSALRRAGVAVPRSRAARTLRAARRLTGVVGSPCLLRPDSDSDTAHAFWIASPEALTRCWYAGARHVLETPIPGLREEWLVDVVEDEVVGGFRCERLDVRAFSRSSPCPLRPSPEAAAVARASAKALRLPRARVTLARDITGEHLVLHVAHREPLQVDAECRALRAWWSGPEAAARSSARRSPIVTATPRKAIYVPSTSYAQAEGPVVTHIQALVRELGQRGIPLSSLAREHDTGALRRACLVLRDPSYAARRPGGRYDGRWLRHALGDRLHLFSPRGAMAEDKQVMHRVAGSLGVRTPTLFAPDELVGAAVLKPRVASQGHGVRLVTAGTANVPSHGMLQAHVDPGIPYAVHVRVVTVRDRPVSAAMYYRRNALRSNLALGASAVALVGPGARLGVSAEEAWLLTRVGIDPDDRGLPSEVASGAAMIGRFYGRRGIQMLGQDYVVDAAWRWYFLEVNTRFGLSLFGVTHGDGQTRSADARVLAGQVLADAVESLFLRSRAGAA